MGYRLRQFDEESKFSNELHLEAIGRAVPMAEIKAALRETGIREARVRKLNMVVVMLLTIVMNIYTRLSIGEAMRKLAHGLRFVWPDPDYPVPKDSAVVYRRYQLGAAPMVALFRIMGAPNRPPASASGRKRSLSSSLRDSSIAVTALPMDTA